MNLVEIPKNVTLFENIDTYSGYLLRVSDSKNLESFDKLAGSEVHILMIMLALIRLFNVQ